MKSLNLLYAFLGGAIVGCSAAPETASHIL